MHPLAVRPCMRTRALRLQHVIGNDDRAGRQLRVQPLEHRHVHVLPQIDQHEVERPRKLRERGERIADAKLDRALELRAGELRAGVLGLGKPQFQRDDLATDRARGFRQPGGGVAVGAADLENAPRPALLDEEVHQGSGSTPHRQQEFIEALPDFFLGERVPQLHIALRARFVILDHPPYRRIERRCHGHVPCSLSGRSGEILLQRGNPEAFCFEEALEMLARVDQPARPQDSLLIEQRGEGQTAHLIREPERRRDDIRDAVQPLGVHELALLGAIAVTRQDDIHPGTLVVRTRLDRGEQRLAHRTARRHEQQQRAAAVRARTAELVRPSLEIRHLQHRRGFPDGETAIEHQRARGCDPLVQHTDLAGESQNQG